MKEEKSNLFVSIIIFLAVVAVLVLITINKEPVDMEGEKNMQNTQQIEGVKITILKEGTGDIAKQGDTVSVNYTGKFTDGTAFDSNVDPKFNHVEPLIFTIGAGQVIKGWDVGVLGMKEGEKRMLEISPEYAYGSAGAGGGVIPPNATINFEVELLQINR